MVFRLNSLQRIKAIVGRNGGLVGRIALFVSALFVLGLPVLCSEYLFATDSYETFAFEEPVFFDPVNSSATCNETNYWTPQSPGTTCYRWYLIRKDTSDSSSLRLLLDHDVATTDFVSSTGALDGLSSSWSNYSGNILLPSEDEITAAMALQTRPSLPTDDVTSSPYGGKDSAMRYLKFEANNHYYLNGTLAKNKGFWISGDTGNDEYAYVATAYGRNALLKKTEIIGVRPVIEVEKTRAAKSSAKVDLSPFLVNPTIVALNCKASGTNSYMQGVTSTDKALVFNVSTNNDREAGCIYANSYTGETFADDTGQAIGHGNGLTWIPSKNEIVVVGGSANTASRGKMHYLDDETYRLKNTVDIASVAGDQVFPGNHIEAVAYDKYDNLIIGKTFARAFFVDSNYNLLQSIDIIDNEVSEQDFTYYHGYLYFSSWTHSVNCTNTYPAYICDTPGSTIYVYDARLNRDGTATENFGRLVKRMSAPVALEGSQKEIQDIVFHESESGDEAYIAFTAGGNALFYKVAAEQIATFAPNVSVSYNDKSTGIEVILNSSDQIQVSGSSDYAESNNKHTLTALFTGRSINEGVKVCDYYDNCTTVDLIHDNPNYYNGEFSWLNGQDYSAGHDALALVVGTSQTGISSVKVDGQTLTEGTDYSIAESNNGVTITFTTNYLNTLSVGNHSVNVFASDGTLIVDTSLTVTINARTLHLVTGTTDNIADFTCTPANLQSDCTVTIPNTIPRRTNYEFMGWADEATSSVVQYHPGDQITLTASEKTIFAVWQWSLSFTLTYDANGGSFPTDSETTQTCTADGLSCTVVVSDLAPVMTNATFVGWADNEDDESAEYHSGDQIVLSADKTIYAVYESSGGDDPVDPGDDPVDPGDDPVDPGDDPVDPGDDPVDPGDDPVDPGDDPVDPGDDPVDPGDDPVGPDTPTSDDPVSPGVPDTGLFTGEHETAACIVTGVSALSLIAAAFYCLCLRRHGKKLAGTIIFVQDKTF
ncbi:InlB B-repeat-containing protein [Candidatus Saccharibacteria bacterium]|nr:InlB B-repeat-containing protein [Candidatus Saccharibacteria bacterium]